MLIPLNAPQAIYELIVLAERDPTAALDLLGVLPAAAPEDQLGAAWASYAAGWINLRTQQLKLAESCFSEATRVFTVLQHPTALLDCWRARLILSAQTNTDDTLDREWHTLAAAFATAERPLDVVRTHIQQAAHLNNRRQYLAARNLLLPSEALIMKTGSLDDRGRWQRVLGIALGYTAATERAHQLLVGAAECFVALDAPLEVARTHTARAMLLERCELFASARTALIEALEIYAKLNNQFQMASCQKILGLVESRLGHFDQALTTTLEAQAMFAELGRSPQVALCDLNLGTIAYYSGLLDLAFAAYQRAQQTFEQLHMSFDSLIAQRNQAMILQQQGQATLALERLVKLESLVQERDDALELAKVYQVQAEALHTLQAFDLARERLSLAQASYTRVGDAQGSAVCWLEQGWLAMQQTPPVIAEAVRCFQAAAPLLADRPTHAWRVAYGLARCAEVQGDWASAQAHYRIATSIIADLRSRVWSEHASSGTFRQGAALFEDALLFALQQEDANWTLALVEQQRAWDLYPPPALDHTAAPPALQAAYAAQRAQLHQWMLNEPPPAAVLDAALTSYLECLLRLRHAAPPPARVPPPAFDLAQVRADLTAAYGPDWVALSYTELSNRLLVVVVEATQIGITTCPLDGVLQELVEKASSRTMRRFTYLDLARHFNPSQAPWQPLRDLAARLLPPLVQARLNGSVRLLLMPSGSLHAVPWAVLHVGDGWLCERAMVQIIPALGAWQTLTSRVPSSQAALFIGCSDFGGRADQLPAVPAELAMLRTAWPVATHPLLDAAATRDALLALNRTHSLREFGLLHIATHAQLTFAHGLLAHLKLWDDDLLYDEVQRLQLNGAQVVLSACDGSLSDVLPGEEVMSLGRAWLTAGAREVLASLWGVHDDAVVALLTTVYAELRAGRDLVEALTLAQREVLAQLAADPVGQREAILSCGGFQVLGAGTTWHRSPQPMLLNAAH